MYEPIGKIKLLRESYMPLKIDLWGSRSTKTKGRLRVQDVLQALDWEVVLYVDEKTNEIHICDYENGPLKGLSTCVFEPGQVLKVIGRKFAAEEQGISNMKMGGHINSEVKTSVLEDWEDFTRLTSVVDQLMESSSEMKEKLKSISILSML